MPDVSFRALSVADILAEERGRVQELWSDEARAAAIAARRARAAQYQRAGGLTKSIQGHVARRVATSRAAAFKKHAPDAPSSVRFDKTVKPEPRVRSGSSSGGSKKKVEPKTRAPHTKQQTVPKGGGLKVRCRTTNALGDCV